MNAPCPSGSFIVMSISRLLISKACKGCTSHETWFCRKGSATPISWERGAWCCFGPTMIMYSIGHFPVARILFSGQTLCGNCLLPAKPQAGCETASVSTWTGLYQNLQRTERRGQQQRASHRRLWSAVHLDRYTGCYSSRCHCRPSIRDPPQRSLNITTHRSRTAPAQLRKWLVPRMKGEEVRMPPEHRRGPLNVWWVNEKKKKNE